jgi:MFS family permease
MPQTKIFILFRSKGFLSLWFGNFFYSLGNGLFTICLNWWVLVTTGSEVQLGIVGTLNFLALMIFSIISGIIVDVYHRKKIIILSILFRGIIVLVFPILGIIGVLELWMVYIIAFTQYVTFPFLVNGITAMMPQFIEEDYIMPANAMLDTSYWLATIIGFLSGGFFIEALGLYNLIIISSVIFIISPFLFLGIPYNYQKREATPKLSGFLRDISEGFALIFKDKVLVIVIFTWTGLITIFSMGTTNFGWTVFSDQILNTGEVGYGLLVAASSFSAMIGSVMLSIWGQKFKMGLIFLSGLILGGIGTIFFSITTTLNISLIIIFITYFFFPMLNVPYWTVIQNRVPEKDLGKVSGASFTVNTGLSPISTFVTGVMMEHISVTLPFVLSGFSFLASFIIALFNKEFRNLK